MSSAIIAVVVAHPAVWSLCIAVRHASLVASVVASVSPPCIVCVPLAFAISHIADATMATASSAKSFGFAWRPCSIAVCAALLIMLTIAAHMHVCTVLAILRASILVARAVSSAFVHAGLAVVAAVCAAWCIAFPVCVITAAMVRSAAPITVHAAVCSMHADAAL
jgi:hypothetical protein